MTNQSSPREYSAVELTEVLQVLTRIGVIMLQSGAASFRTKETMDRFAAALHIDQFDAFVTPTKIIGIINSPLGSYTRAMRVPFLGVNMSRVSALNTMSHQAKDISSGELAAWLGSVEAAGPNY